MGTGSRLDGRSRRCGARLAWRGRCGTGARRAPGRRDARHRGRGQLAAAALHAPAAGGREPDLLPARPRIRARHRRIHRHRRRGAAALRMGFVRAAVPRSRGIAALPGSRLLVLHADAVGAADVRQAVSAAHAPHAGHRPGLAPVRRAVHRGHPLDRLPPLFERESGRPRNGPRAGLDRRGHPDDAGFPMGGASQRRALPARSGLLDAHDGAAVGTRPTRGAGDAGRRRQPPGPHRRHHQRLRRGGRQQECPDRDR